MKTSFQNLVDALDESLAQLIWDEWCEIGGSGSTQKQEVPFVIDIESLILGTTRFGRRDPRIMEQCIDWLARNGDLVSLQRIKNMQQNLRFGDELLLRKIAEFMVEEKYLNWKSIAKSFESPSARVGERASLYRARGLSRAPGIMKPQSLLLRLRRFFGMSARADAFCWLLTHPEGHAAEIAKETHWMPKTVQLVLIELEQSRSVSCVVRGRQKRYRLNPDDWEVFKPAGGSSCWFNSSLLFSGCSQLVSLLEGLCGLEDGSEALQSMDVARSMPELTKTFFGLIPAASFQQWEREPRGEALVRYFQKECETLIRSINSRLFYSTESFPRMNPIQLVHP